MTGAKPSINVHEENGKSALEPNIDSRSRVSGKSIYTVTSRLCGRPKSISQQFTAVYKHNLQEYSTMSKNVTQKLIASDLVEDRMKLGEEIDLWRTS